MALYVFTGKKCVNCPAVKEALKENNIDFKEIDIDSKMFANMQHKLLINNIVVMTTPTIVKENGDKLEEVKVEDLI